MPGASSDPIQTRELSANKLIVGVGQTPVTTQAAYTQTYSTASKTASNPTAATVGDQGATQNTGWGADTEAHFDEIRTLINQLVADVLNLKQVQVAIINDLQAFGMAG